MPTPRHPARRPHLAAGVLCAAFAGSLAAQNDACPAPPIEAGGAFDERIRTARAWLDAGCRPAALDLAGRLLERAEAEEGADSLAVAAALDLLAEASYWLGRRDEAAIAAARRAVALRRRQPDDPEALAVSRRNLGALLASRVDDGERLAEALELYEAARVAWLRTAGEASPEVADLLTWIAELLDDWGTDGHQRAVQLPWIAALLDPRSIAARDIRVALAELGSDAGSRILARIVDDPSLAVAARAVALARWADAATPTYAEALNMLGALLHRRQLHDEALEVFDACLQVRQEVFPPHHPQVARAYHNRGEARMLTGDLEGARADLERAYELRRQAAGEAFPGVVATSLRLLGKLLVFTGDLEGALRLFRDALPRLRATYGDAHWRTAAGHVSLAETFEALGEPGEAERHYRQAVDALERSVAPQPARQAEARARLGGLLVEQGRAAAGEAWLRGAQDTLSTLAMPPLEAAARTFLGLARSAEARADIAGALELYRAAVETLEGYRGVHPDLVDVLLATAESELALGRATAAALTLGRAAEHLPRLGPTAWEARARHLLLRARLTALAGREDAQALALGDAARAAELYALHLAAVFRVLPPDTALRHRRRLPESLDLALTLLAAEPAAQGAAERVWRAVARHRGLLSRELEERALRLRGADDPELRAALERLDAARRLQARVQVRIHRGTTLEEQQVLLRYADAKVRATERAVAELTAPDRRSASPPEGAIGDSASPADGASPAEVARLGEGAALVAYVRFRDGQEGSYGAFVGRPDRPAAFVRLAGAARVDAAVVAWREALLDGRDAAGEAVLQGPGAELRRLIWDPVGALVGERRRIHLVLDGALFLVPFAALPGAEDGTYLLEDGLRFERRVSERDRHRGSASGVSRRLLAVGGVDYGARRSAPPALGAGATRDPCREHRPIFLPLPGARREAREVAAIFAGGAPGRVTALAGPAATEAAFKRLAPRHGFLHVATHGFFDLHCGSGAVRGLAERLLDPPEPFLAEVSGLAFAGANRPRAAADGIVGSADSIAGSADDGILTASEIAALDLSGVEWVVLSACETAIGHVAAGEGVLGLARSFRVAGAGTLVLSLWPVDDRATRRFMSALYRGRFRDALPTSEALGRASLERLRERRRAGASTHPIHWAAFVAVGG